MVIFTKLKMIVTFLNKMKSILNFLGGGIIALSICACQDTLSTERTISFRVSIMDNTKTRTEYSGETIGSMERIDWSNDDQVKIFMYGNNIPEERVYSVINIRSENEKSIGNLDVENNPIVWKDNGGYEFCGVYPIVFDGSFNQSSKDFTFTLPREQLADLSQNMKRYAIMTAYSKNDNSSFDMENVSLDFYPMVTTIYVTIANDMTQKIDLGQIKLTSKQRSDNWQTNSLVGSFNASLDSEARRYITNEDEGVTDWSDWQGLTKEVILNINKTLMPGDRETVAFFIRPIHYQASALTLTLQTSLKQIEHSLGETMMGESSNTITYLNPRNKYNLNIRLSSGRTLADSDISDALAQMLSLYLKQYMGDYFNTYFPNVDWNDFQNKTINNWNNLTGTDFKKLFEEYLDKIQAILETVEDFGPFSDRQVNHPITPEDFQFFQNLKHLSLQSYSSVNLSGLDNLQSVDLEYPTEVIIDKCESLTDISLRNVGGDLTRVNISYCPEVTKFDSNPWDTKNAEFSFEYMEKLKEISVFDASKISANNCPELTTITFEPGRNPLIAVDPNTCGKYHQ